MKTTHQFTALIEREGDGYVALCPELDIASQADTVDEARRNLQEALELFFETASKSEVGVLDHKELRNRHAVIYYSTIQIAAVSFRIMNRFDAISCE